MNDATATYKLGRVTSKDVCVYYGGLRHILPWQLLRAAAEQQDPTLREAYRALLWEATSKLRVAALFDQLAPGPARRAAAINETYRGGYVLGALFSFIRCPEGGWPETQQAWRDLVNAVAVTLWLPGDADLDIPSVCQELVTAARRAGWGEVVG